MESVANLRFLVAEESESIPQGLHPLAQGCTAASFTSIGATLGNYHQSFGG